MNFIEFIIPPIMGGIIALSTNWLAIRMLFRPLREKRIFGIRVPFTPGLIPRERKRLTKKLAEAISTKLLTPDVLANELSDPALWPLPDMTVGEALAQWGLDSTASIMLPLGGHLKIIADNLLPHAIDVLQTFPETHPDIDSKLADFTKKVVDDNVSGFAGMFVSKNKIYNSIKAGLMEYLSDGANHEFIREKIHMAIDNLLTSEASQKITTEKLYAFHLRNDLSKFLSGEKQKHAIQRALSILANYLARHMPIQSMIENKMSAFELEEAEALILSVAGRELRLIIWLGGVLGFIIGLFMVFL